MLPFPMNISLEQKYTYPVHDIQDRKSLQQVLPCLEWNTCYSRVDPGLTSTYMAISFLHRALSKWTIKLYACSKNLKMPLFCESLIKID